MKKYIVIISLFTFGCAGVNPPTDFVYEEIQTETFKIAIWQKINNPSSEVRIYIEGDGYAFNGKGQPTQNPTPKSDLVRNLAYNDSNDNVIYMGRVCQYVTDEKCEQKYWTTARFSKDVIESTAEAIKKIAGKNEVVLIGYSGGAQVGGLVAVTHPEIRVQKMITIAGNLDHKAWTDYHNLPPLSGSLSLSDHKEKYATFSQTHFVGEKDEVIPPFINENFITDKTTFIKLPTVTHSTGWLEIKERIYLENK